MSHQDENDKSIAPQSEISPDHDGETLTPLSTESIEYYQQSIKDGYRALLGIALGLGLAELILLIGKVDGDPPKIFALLGVIFAVRHLLQIWQAKQQIRLKQLGE